MSQELHSNSGRFKLGEKAKDKVTGFEGIIIGRAEYLTGCDQYGLTPPAKDGKVEKNEWFDEGRIEIIGEGFPASAVMGSKKGGPNRDTPN
ncbi:MAG: hypothetical protein H7Y13_11945 [Sphingobacteriaceae bacterium]|nr:hypothetical protein [Sphingobacteriaceae bacterium]